MLPSIAHSLTNVVTDIINDSKERAVMRDQLKAEIERFQTEREQDTKKHVKNMSEMRLHLQVLQDRTDKIQSQQLPVHRYASELKSQATPSHILLLQAQVCREIHCMCVDVAQLTMLENAAEDLKLLAKDQQQVQLKCLLWAVEAKAELRQQQEDDIYQLVDVCAEASSSGIDDLLTHLSSLNFQNPSDMSNDEEELTLEVLKADKKSGRNQNLECFLNEDEEQLHKSLPTIGETVSFQETKADKRRSMINKDTWNSEKPQVAW